MGSLNISHGSATVPNSTKLSYRHIYSYYFFSFYFLSKMMDDWSESWRKNKGNYSRWANMLYFLCPPGNLPMFGTLLLLWQIGMTVLCPSCTGGGDIFFQFHQRSFGFWSCTLTFTEPWRLRFIHRKPAQCRMRCTDWLLVRHLNVLESGWVFSKHVCKCSSMVFFFLFS